MSQVTSVINQKQDIKPSSYFCNLMFCLAPAMGAPVGHFETTGCALPFRHNPHLWYEHFSIPTTVASATVLTKK